MNEPSNIVVLLGGMLVLAIPSIACAIRARSETSPSTKKRLCFWAALTAFPAFIAIGFVLDSIDERSLPTTLFIGITGTLIMYAIARGHKRQLTKTQEERHS